MDSACLRHTEIPHTSRLFADFLYHFDRVAPFYSHPQGDFERAAAEIDYPGERRAALVRVLREQNGDSPSLELLAKPGTVAVVTGQQVGLFSGPAYTIYKALTAARLARELTARGTPAVPVFWLATEDHDFAEVGKVWIFDGAHQPVALEVAGPAGSQQPVGGIHLDSFPVAALEETLRPFPFGAEVAELVGRAYPAGATMGGAFKTLLRELLSQYGLLFVDPLCPELRAIGAPLLAKAVENVVDLKALLVERNRALTSAGYHAQVHIEPQTSLFFLLENGRRVTLRRQDGAYVSKDRRYSPEELAGRASELSPNALLRPVLQDYILPTVTYIGGPAELAYMAQAQVLYSTLLGRMPVVTPRAAFTLLDARAAKLLERYGLTMAQVFAGNDALAGHIAQALLPSSTVREFADTTAEITARIDRLGSRLNQFDPTLGAALGKSRAKILYQLAKLEHKAASEAMRRQERAQSDAAYLSGLLFPHQHLQERLYSILPFLAQHGFGLIDRVYENVRLECHDHQVLTV
ncbi:MAG: bacillithiol biosynthesis cysteine-adding enzyme BshC [Bryobacteraceae bacterium]